MTAPIPHEVDLWSEIQIRLASENQQNQFDLGWNSGLIRIRNKIERSLGYSEGTPVPTAAHYAALKELGFALADELEAELRARYDRTLDHPAMAMRFERDMASVLSFRAALEPSK